MADEEADYMKDVEEFDSGASKTGLKKLNGMVKAIKAHDAKLKQGKASPYLFIFSNGGTLEVFKLTAERVGADSDSDPNSETE